MLIRERLGETDGFNNKATRHKASKTENIKQNSYLIFLQRL